MDTTINLSHLASVKTLNSLIDAGNLDDYLALDEDNNISITSFDIYAEAERDVGVSFISSWADGSEGVLSYDYNGTPELYCIDVFKQLNIYNALHIDDDSDYEKILEDIDINIKSDIDALSGVSPFDTNCEYKTSLVVIELALYSWFKNNFKAVVHKNTEEANMKHFVFGYKNYSLVEGHRGTDPNSYKYLGSDFEHYPKYLSGDDVILNSLLDLCLESLEEDADCFYLRTHADGVRESNITKSWAFNKSGDGCLYINNYPNGESDQPKVASLSAAGGKNGVAGRPYYFISIVIAGKTRQIGFHKILGVLANSAELISLRDKLGCPLTNLVPNHKNNCGTDNSTANLEMVSSAENALHSHCIDIISANRPDWLVDKDHTPEVWVKTKDSWVVPNRNILKYRLSISDVYKFIDAEGIVLGSRPIRDIINPIHFIKYLEGIWEV